MPAFSIHLPNQQQKNIKNIHLNRDLINNIKPKPKTIKYFSKGDSWECKKYTYHDVLYTDDVIYDNKNYSIKITINNIKNTNIPKYQIFSATIYHQFLSEQWNENMSGIIDYKNNTITAIEPTLEDNQPISNRNHTPQNYEIDENNNLIVKYLANYEDNLGVYVALLEYQSVN